jgi:AraC-like DNA-binding protein
MRIRQTIRSSILGRHVHETPYAALVLSGCYEEAGDTGRHRVTAGDVIFHEAFEAHLDRIPQSRVEVLNLPLPADYVCQAPLAKISDPDVIVSLAEKNKDEAAALLLSSTEIREPEYQDWPDELAASLIRDASMNFSSWSEVTEISAWNLSRGFARIFGISPSGFRARARIRQAWRAIRTTNMPLSAIAADCGFADQAHMTRGIKSMTGQRPTAWRRACK